MSGETNPACTSLPSKWVIPPARTSVKNVPLQDLIVDWNKPKHGTKRGQRQPMYASQRQHFDPRQTRKAPPSLHDFVAIIRDSAPEAVLLTAVEPEQFPAAMVTETVQDQQHKMVETPTLLDMAEKYIQSSSDPNVDNFVDSMVFTDHDAKNVEEETRGQATNPKWARHRAGRITASNLRRVYTRYKTLSSKTSQSIKNPEPIVKELMGYSSTPGGIGALKYGREMEGLARDQYCNIQSTIHKNMTVTESGLVVSTTHPFLGASPDGLVSCDCCGHGLLEIKCPSSIAQESPLSAKLPYLVEDDSGHLTLKVNPAYFTQVQGQMAITGRTWCDFFVFTQHGYFIERIKYNSTYWADTLENLVGFFKQFLAKELLYKEVAESQNGPPVTTSRSHTDKGKGKAVMKKSESICKACKVTCREESCNSIECDSCKTWWHFPCVGIFSEDDIPADWDCVDCEAKQRPSKKQEGMLAIYN